MHISMTDDEIIFLVECSPEPYGENGQPLYENFYPIFGGWKQFAYWRLSRKFPKPSKEYDDLTSREAFAPDEFTTDICSWLSGYNESMERPSNYDTPHP